MGDFGDRPPNRRTGNSARKSCRFAGPICWLPAASMPRTACGRGDRRRYARSSRGVHPARRRSRLGFLTERPFVGRRRADSRPGPFFRHPIPRPTRRGADKRAPHRKPDQSRDSGPTIRPLNPYYARPVARAAFAGMSAQPSLLGWSIETRRTKRFLGQPLRQALHDGAN